MTLAECVARLKLIAGQSNTPQWQWAELWKVIHALQEVQKLQDRLV